MAAGEEGVLRQRLRQMEVRQSSVQRCGVVATTQASLQEGLRSVQTQLNAVLAEEHAQADAPAGSFSWTPFSISHLQSLLRSMSRRRH